MLHLAREVWHLFRDAWAGAGGGDALGVAGGADVRGPKFCAVLAPNGGGGAPTAEETKRAESTSEKFRRRLLMGLVLFGVRRAVRRL